MANYYDVLRSAVETVPDAGGREAIYDRARHAMTDRMRSATPPIPDTVIEAEQAALEEVINRVEADMRGDAPAEPANPPETPDAGLNPQLEPRRRFPRWLLGAAAVVVAGIVAVLATVFLRPGQKSIERSAGSSGIEIDDRRRAASQSTDNARAYVFGRQLIYYRTTHPPGTIIIDKGQRFLYLVRPNVSATRYGIGVGKECSEMPALLRVSRKAMAAPTSDDEAEWMGLRLMFLESDGRLIHGTNRPDTIGHLVRLGCVRLVNEDVIELYNQTPIGGRVVVSN
jgi:lipoprotein-anchoring transpeptidase ErfK/SrfK